jgi:hypothetical protein
LDSASDLSKGGVYFTFAYCDEDMRYPSVSAYVYLGAGLLGGAVSKHFFQATDSYQEHGNWAAMSEEERLRLGPDAVICCDEKDLSLMKNVDELIEELAEFRSPSGPGS